MATLYRMGMDPRARAWGGSGLTADQASDIGAVLERDVIPKLLVAHAAEPAPPPDPGAEIHLGEAARLAELAIEREAHDLLTVIETVMRRGVPVERILVDLLAPAARHLGEDWETDRLDFVQVSMGLWRLQQVMRELAARSPRAHPVGHQRSALFLAFPGDDHSFGAAMVQECFALAGWQADLLLGGGAADLLQQVAVNHFDVVGLTITSDAHAAQLPSLLRAVRSVSANPRLCLMIGGRVPTLDPDLALRAGADGTASTAICAVRAAEAMVKSARLSAAT